MKDEQIKEYTRRITQANESGLTVILFELMIESVEEAKTALTAGNLVESAKQLTRARQFLNEQLGSLDYRYSIAQELHRIYVYVDQLLVKAQYAPEMVMLDDVQGILEELCQAYEEVSKQDTREAVMGNTQQVYSGLTYGKTALADTMVDTNPVNRGFRA